MAAQVSNVELRPNLVQTSLITVAPSNKFLFCETRPRKLVGEAPQSVSNHPIKTFYNFLSSSSPIKIWVLKKIARLFRTSFNQIS